MFAIHVHIIYKTDIKSSMKKIILSLMALATVSAYAQFGARRNPTVPSSEALVEDFKPASNNQSGHQYSEVYSKRQVRAQISAPDAT